MSASEAPAVPATAEAPVDLTASPETETPATVEQPDKLQVRDVHAQEEMADAAFLMLAVALVTFIVTSVGTWAIWRQTRLTREALTTTREIGEAQVRCYPSPRGASFRMDNLGIPNMRITVLNAGQSPARNFRWVFQVSVANLHDEWVWESPEFALGELGGKDIPAQQEEGLELAIPPPEPLPQGQLADLLQTPPARVTASVAVAWFDVFGMESRQTWRFQASTPLGFNAEVELFPDIPPIV